MSSLGAVWGLACSRGKRRGRKEGPTPPSPPGPDVSPRNRTSEQAAAVTGGDESAAVQPEMDAGVLRGAHGAHISRQGIRCFPGQSQAQPTPQILLPDSGPLTRPFPTGTRTYTDSSRLLTYTARTSRTTQNSYYSYFSHDFASQILF